VQIIRQIGEIVSGTHGWFLLCCFLCPVIVAAGNIVAEILLCSTTRLVPVIVLPRDGYCGRSHQWIWDLYQGMALAVP
jgi:hypothetical protein